MKKWIVLLVFVAAIWLLPLLIPLAPYVRQAEQHASDVLGVPLVIDSAKIQLLPSPRVVAHGVHVGGGSDVSVEELSVVPELSSIFSAQRVISVMMDGVLVKKTALVAYDIVQSRLAGRQSDANAPVLVKQVQIDHLDVSALVGLPVMRASAGLADNALQSLRLETHDRTLVADLLPQGQAQALQVKLHDFVLPGHRLKVDEGEVRASLQAKALHITQVELRMLDGKVTGQGELGWQSSAKASGKFQLQGVAMRALTRTGRGPYLSGGLSGNGSLGAETAQLGGLLDHLWVEARLEVKEGVLHGIDLVKIAKLLLKQGGQGGETAFDTLRTQLKVQGKRTQFKQLELESGLMTAKGNVDVLDGKQLEGAVTVAVKATAGMLEVPLDVGGTVDAPTVLPDKAAALGAAVGTALMPGVGTSLGIKAGSQFKKLFGRD
ncbi:AsmA-like C-terminal region-containing protein [Methylophilus aquaticus]|uniref:AsmA-like C-terminal region-containing protein n=1 Tax=Methylophilus aquaticus TaxID=1971610 RepID=A0ABT9JUZ0_9PROT|nr:AsmA-like C-terminal region-containing protein [Methylophilus aquaticus]MDP8568383.1 AsmA-like C-terminal region-containing protein [Methylophilus aquaticus]